MKEEILNMLKTLAEKLGTTTEYLWATLVHQAYIAAIQEIVFLLITIVFSFILFKCIKRVQMNGENALYITQLILAAFIVLIFLIVSIIDLSDLFNGFFNPEYWALQQLIYMLN